MFPQTNERKGATKEKDQKKERAGPWNLPQLRKSIKVAFGDILLMIFTAAWKTCWVSHSYHQPGGGYNKNGTDNQLTDHLHRILDATSPPDSVEICGRNERWGP
jgi:hypothetical protein